jgi:hypothetical protein
MIVGAENQENYVAPTRQYIEEIDATNAGLAVPFVVICPLCPMDYSAEYPIDKIYCQCGSEFTIKW